MKVLQTIFLTVLIISVIIRIFLSFLYAPHLTSGQNLNFVTTLLTEPTSHRSFETMTVSYSNGFSAVPLSLAFPPGSGLHYGEPVAISGHIKYKRLTVSSNQNARVLTELSSLKFVVQKDKTNWLLSFSYYLRQHIQHLYTNVLPANAAALLLGIVLGTKTNFPTAFLKELQLTGVVHVLAAEGLNVIITAEFLLGIFGLFLKRQWAIALTIVGLLFYCMLCGFQPSIVRSTIMMGFALGAQMVGRQYSGLYGLLLAASGMLLYNPVWLFDIGFQLSFAATLGIYFLKPLLPKFGLIGDDVSTTIAAQVATLPILIGSFGSYGLLSVPANALVLWTIPPLMVLGGIGGVISLIFEPVGTLFIYLCFPFLFFFEKTIDFFASFPWQLSLPEVPLSLTVGYYLVLGSIVLFLEQKNRLRRKSL